MIESIDEDISIRNPKSTDAEGYPRVLHTLIYIQAKEIRDGDHQRPPFIGPHRRRRHTLSPALAIAKCRTPHTHMEESQSGPPRKYYSLTPKGIDTLTALKATWTNLTRSVNHLIA